MTHKCELCNKDFETEDSLKQHNISKHSSKESKKINFRKYFIMLSIALIILLLGLSFYTSSQKPGQYDDFAKCLTEKGVVVYGNDFCKYTNNQLGYFDKSKEYLNYVKCAENEKLCNDKNVKITPTWEINGEMYEQVQTFEKLSAVSGCNL